MIDSEPHSCCAAGGESVALPQRQNERTCAVPRSARSTKGQVLLPAATFEMGDAFGEGYLADGETPVHQVRLNSFYIDTTVVTNAAFARFVKDVGYVTEAEEVGMSAVFHLAVQAESEDILYPVTQTPWWLVVRGANWRHPAGPESNIVSLQNHPVVHVSWRDANAYAAWAGKRLPTEAEWEFAARGGLNGKRYAWGDELTPRNRWMCNIWQGRFPDINMEEDGFFTTAPVKSFPPNRFGLWNTAGNVWEWCSDWFDPNWYSRSPLDNPQGPDLGQFKVMRGGSFLCHHSYCNRYRVAARSSNTPDSFSMNIGFRCASDGDARN